MLTFITNFAYYAAPSINIEILLELDSTQKFYNKRVPFLKAKDLKLHATMFYAKHFDAFHMACPHFLQVLNNTGCSTL